VAREFIIYADESESRGRYYSNFYGGALVRSPDLAAVEARLERAKRKQGFAGEVKWDKVTSQYLDRYVRLMDVFFDLVAADRVKVRIMFTHNIHEPRGLTDAQQEDAYFILYYQFIKHAFGLAYSNPSAEPLTVRLYFDRLPDTRERVAAFKGYLRALSNSPQFRRAKIRITSDRIAEVDSHQHVILQCLDVVLGSMQFRLNDKHKAKPLGSRRRGKRTIAKEKLYRHISRRIRRIYPRFNIGISTGLAGERQNRWRHPYRHWVFVPKDHRKDFSRSKP
jgi:hypothetical protein